MSRLKTLFENKDRDILNVYFTAGFPQLNDTERIVLALDEAGADLIEIGMPYSDPLADGPTIQQSGAVALQNGMTLEVLFKQLASLRQKTEIPLILMGYFNQVLQYGAEAFFRDCRNCGVDGLILPDMPLDVFEEDYQSAFQRFNLDSVFLITPQTEENRIRYIDQLSSGFVYVVSSYAITGGSSGISAQQIDYFKRLEKMKLHNPRLIGFGISDFTTFSTACQHAQGAIIGSAFIRMIEHSKNLEVDIHNFVKSIKGIKVQTTN